MADSDAAAGAQGGKKLLTLTEVSRRTGISMPTLQKYKKQHAARIPSVGSGRTQRYPEEALPVFAEIRQENLGRRGRPPKSTAKAPARKTARKTARKPARKTKSTRGARRPAQAAASKELLTLTEIGKRTGISYPTLLRYVKEHLDEIPHQGTGRKRRFPQEAVEAFRNLRKRPRRAARKAAAPRRRKTTRAAASAGRGGDLRQVTTILKRLEKRLSALESEVKKPVKVKVVR